MCSSPVMFGGGSAITYGSRSESGIASEHAGGLPPLEDGPLCAGGVETGFHGPPS